MKDSPAALEAVDKHSMLHAVIQRCFAIALMMASGFAALGYQIIWTQQSSLWLGHEAIAVLAVVAAFFGGLGIGALTFGARIDRSTRPTYWYVACEAIIALWSLILAIVAGPISNSLLDFIGAQPSPSWHLFVAFCGTFLLLLPATAAMGATLPAMERTLAVMHKGTPIAELYAANTTGAVLGVLLAAFWLIPQYGLIATASVCATTNVLCAAMAASVFPKKSGWVPTSHASNPHHHLLPLAITGFLGIGYEVIVVRVLSQVAENTVYTFSILLVVYLIGTALGASTYSRWLASKELPWLRNSLLQILTLACSISVLILNHAANIKSWTLQSLGISMFAALCAEAAIAVAAFLLPTVMMGMLFSHLSTYARQANICFGHALGTNTLGAALAPSLFGVWLLPALGAKFSLLIIAVGYLIMTTRRAWNSPAQWLAAAVVFALMIGSPGLIAVNVPEGGRLVSYAEGSMAAVSVVADAFDVKTLHIDNRQQEGSSATLLADARQALLPILLHPAPRRALFLGLGTSATAMSAAEDSQLEVDAVELLPEVAAAAAQFKDMFDDDAQRDARLHVLIADARRFVRATHVHYDVIVSDNFHPARSGSASLYTVEHFTAVRNRLTADGLFCQWLPLHQLDLDTLRIIVRSYLQAFPHGGAILATNSLNTPVVGLVAFKNEQLIAVDAVRRRLQNVAMSHHPSDFGIQDEFALLGSYIAGPTALTQFAGTVSLNTDDRPIVAYVAPRITYSPNSLPRDRLLNLLHELQPDAREVVTSTDAEWKSRMTAYWTARNQFLEVGRNIRATTDVQLMLRQVREPLLSVLHLSSDFRPAYDPLLRMANALQDSDPAAAQSLLVELQPVHPPRVDAR